MYGLMFKCLNCGCSGCSLDWSDFITDEEESKCIECGSTNYILGPN